MDIKQTRYDIDMHGNQYSYEVDVHYYYDEWADFDD